MKKIAKIFLILFTISTVFTGCRETTGDKVEDAVEDVADGVEDAADDVEDVVE
ncbi:hypothetical protein [uncultured Algibacter sp.]|uniref:hypothetical protein n=1 Tax=uncultured Algibacter sp. TaxID=298659 RepID=UPI002637909A|nr:hypothetical protein [uncultured Algibacter sp.]